MNYLPEHGWTPIGVTPELPRSPPDTWEVIETQYRDVLASYKRLIGLDETVSLGEQLDNRDKGESPFFRSLVDSCGRRLREIVAFPDRQRGWRHPALEAIRDYLEANQVDAILSSFSPGTSHVIARKISIEFDLPWVADFRDPWSQHHMYSWSPGRRFLETLFERHVIRPASALTVAWPDMVDCQRKLHGTGEVFSIPHGFDPNELRTEEIGEVSGSPSSKESTFIICYTGNFYPEFQMMEPFLEGLSELQSRANPKGPSIEFQFFGPTPSWEWVRKKAAQYDVGEITLYGGYVDRARVLRAQRSASVLLLAGWKRDNPGPVPIPAKFFEYLAARRPILCTGDRSDELHRLLSESKAGKHVPDSSTVGDALYGWYQEFRRTGEVSPPCGREALDAYTQQTRARQFAEVLDRVVNRERRS